MSEDTVRSAKLPSIVCLSVGILAVWVRLAYPGSMSWATTFYVYSIIGAVGLGSGIVAITICSGRKALVAMGLIAAGNVAVALVAGSPWVFFHVPLGVALVSAEALFLVSHDSLQPLRHRIRTIIGLALNIFFCGIVVADLVYAVSVLSE
jgi:hypothetical protein